MNPTTSRLVMHPINIRAYSTFPLFVPQEQQRKIRILQNMAREGALL
jgi:hypothetical protein